MSEDDNTDQQLERLYKNTSLSLAHSKLTEYPPLSVDEQDNVLRSLFVTRPEVEKYAKELREREEREWQEAKDREAALKAQRENDPQYWKRLYEGMVEREEERKDDQERTRTLWISGIIFGAAAFAILYIIKRVL